MKRVKEIAVLLLALCLLLTLSACGDRGPKAADAENYVMQRRSSVFLLQAFPTA